MEPIGEKMKFHGNEIYLCDDIMEMRDDIKVMPESIDRAVAWAKEHGVRIGAVMELRIPIKEMKEMLHL